MQDSVIDPFETLTEELDFFTLKMDQTYSEEYQSGYVIYILLSLKIQRDAVVMSRKRYSLWDALGDIGGFHDGLVLVVGTFMTGISAFFYESDLTGGKPFLSKLSNT